MDAKRLEKADPPSLLSNVFLLASSRKMRLLACGCCRALRDLTKVRYCLPNIEIAERFADGLATDEDLRAAREATYFPIESRRAGEAIHVVDEDAYEAAWRVVHACLSIDGKEFWIWQLQKHRESRIRYARLVEDVLYPWLTRAVPFDGNWKTSTAVALATQMYDSRDFAAMPILADALQDAGCDSADILDHCRGPGPHVRGCWVVDLVLGKE